MKHKDLPKLSVEPHLSKDAATLRKKAPDLIASVIEKTHALPQIDSIEDLRSEQVSVLGGGVNAAVYLVRSSNKQVIIKLHYDGLEAEAEALKAWKARHVRVPSVLDSGIVLKTKNSKRPIKYLIQSAMLDKHGRIVETCASYLVDKPDKARAIGRLLGKELNKLHSAIANRSFGEFSDSPGNTAAYASWNAYMLGYLDAQTEYLKSIGVSEKQLAGVQKYIEDCKFIKTGRYLHGDFSIRNAAIKSHEPLAVALFDPNPLIGDPTWDVAVLFNNYEYQKRRMEYDDRHRELYIRDQQLLAGFKQGYDRTIRKKRLKVAQLMQAALQAKYKSDKVRANKSEPLELRVRNEFLSDIIGEISGSVK